VTSARTPPSDADDDPVMDRRVGDDRRSGKERREHRAPVGRERRAGDERRKEDRRREGRPPRNINQYDMPPDVLEFVNAVQRHRASTGNRFPSAGEILQILKELGYEKRA